MNYDNFIKKANDMGIEPKEALPNFFIQIEDDFPYTVEEIAKQIVHKSEETVRRWCREGKVKIEGKRPYKILGIELKRYLFIEFYPEIRKRYNNVI
ncbi:helix-turn-helix domain-containing protein [Rossellomorea sp. NS-SX7]|uniref:helix-turn-helix domain-containing protein n=1 Tax=Rossellomorea sp. NS-SX7 TaxID=3463856 RepID=UPI004059B1A4